MFSALETYTSNNIASGKVPTSKVWKFCSIEKGWTKDVHKEHRKK